MPQPAASHSAHSADASTARRHVTSARARAPLRHETRTWAKVNPPCGPSGTRIARSVTSVGLVGTSPAGSERRAAVPACSNAAWKISAVPSATGSAAACGRVRTLTSGTSASPRRRTAAGCRARRPGGSPPCALSMKLMPSMPTLSHRSISAMIRAGSPIATPSGNGRRSPGAPVSFFAAGGCRLPRLW